MKFKKIFLGATAALGTAFVATGLTSCSKEEEGGLKVCLASTPQHVDPALNSAVDGACYAVHAFSGLVRYVPNEQGDLVIAPDLCKELPTGEAVGTKTKYTFELRDNIKFSNGKPITAQDFVDSWNRASGKELGADYAFMFDVIDRIDDNTLNISAKDEKTLEVVLPVDSSYFMELCAFPAYDVLYDAKNLDAEGKWAKNPKKFVGSGAYTLKSYKDNVKLVLEKNDNYWDAENVTMEKINFIFSDDDSSTYAQFLNDDLQFVDSMDASTAKTEKTGDNYHVIEQLGTYYVCFNVNSDLFSSFNQHAQEEIRTALSLLIDRKHICEDIVGTGETPATGFVGAKLTDVRGGYFVDYNGEAEDGSGWAGDPENYSANVAAAKEILDKYFTKDASGKYQNFPSIDYIINTNTTHEAIATEIKQEYANLGITLNIASQEWNTFIQTRKDGEFDVARNGWVADYNDPSSFLELFMSDSGNNDCQLGKGKVGEAPAASFTYSVDLSSIAGYTSLTGTWAETYDELIDYIRTEADFEKRFALMHKAESLLMSTGAVAPVYNYVDDWLQSTKLKNVYASPLGFKFFHWSTLED